MEAEFKSNVLYPHLWHFSKNGQNWTFCPKRFFFSTISACIFNSINVCLYPLHSIYNFIAGKLNFQKSCNIALRHYCKRKDVRPGPPQNPYPLSGKKGSIIV